MDRLLRGDHVRQNSNVVGDHRGRRLVARGLDPQYSHRIPSVGAGLADPATNGAERPALRPPSVRAGLADPATKAKGDEAESPAPGSHRPRDRAERYCGRT